MTETTARARSSSPSGPAGTGPAGGAGRGPAQTRPAPPARSSGTGGLERMAWAFATLYLEVEAGRRPRAQVARLMTPMLAARLAEAWIRPGPPATIATVAGTRTAPDRYDAVVLVRRGRRYTALALGFERHAGKWTVASAVRPEDGPLPDAPIFPPDEPADVVLDEPDRDAVARARPAAQVAFADAVR